MQNFDHLVLKQPLCLTVNIFSKNDPYRMLVENKTLRLTDFYDCVEAMRSEGGHNLESLAVIDSMDVEVKLNEKYLYYLKLQLIVLNVKLFHYTSKSESISKSFEAIEATVKTLIAAVCSFLMLKSMASIKKPAPATQMSMRCLVKSLRQFISDEECNEPYKDAQESFKKEIKVLVDKCKFPSTLDPEICLHCEAPIDKEKLICENNHKVNRCIITKLQVPIDSNNFCSNCYCCVLEQDILKRITGVDDPLCPFCDRRFNFG